MAQHHRTEQSPFSCYGKSTGADVGAVNMPARQTGSPMTYMLNGRQYIVVAVSGVGGAELIAYALPL
jgi:quinoprotein glucose dehydrogenase